MLRHNELETRMVAVQLCTDEGAYVCNVDEHDVGKMAVREPGVFILIHFAIRLDAMFGGQYEIHRTKIVETSSIESHQLFDKKAKRTSVRSRSSSVAFLDASADADV